jgi:haloacetate dehalogenase
MNDLYAGFDTHRFRTEGAEIFARTGGSGPPLLLLHGFPQSHVMWHKVAPQLAEHFSLVIADLRGYGQSSCPVNDAENLAYSKRVMARDMITVMVELGHDKFLLAGHDRGGRVSYRLALDHPGRVEKLAVLDIIPTHTMWQNFTVAHAMNIYHWLFLAQPHPLPETLIGRASDAYLDHTIAHWTKSGDLSAFAPQALAAYHDFFAKPEHIHALCNDYRAGQTCDYEHDIINFDAGVKIACPMLALWGDAGIPSSGNSPLDVWQQWANEVEGMAIDSGHFVVEENPEATAQALLDFFRDK